MFGTRVRTAGVLTVFAAGRRELHAGRVLHPENR